MKKYVLFQHKKIIVISGITFSLVISGIKANIDGNMPIDQKKTVSKCHEISDKSSSNSSSKL